ncbi:MAG: TrmH family RNA methyltransferase [Fusobacteriota bacterium]
MASRLITSKNNKFIKKVKKLKKKKYREKYNMFIAEGEKFLEFDYKPKYAIIDEFYDGTVHIDSDIEEYVVKEELFNKISTQKNSQGIILIYDIPENDSNKINNDIVILDKIQDPGNLGTMIRLFDAVGIKDIILLKGTVDQYNDKVVRSTMGSIFNLNFYEMTHKEILDFLKQKEYNIISTDLSEESFEYDKMKLRDKNAIIFGNEGNGISKKLLNISDQKVMIPIYGSAESLNVAVASGIIMYKYKEILSKI